MEGLGIAQLFPSASTAEWRSLVEKALANKPFECLISTTFEGLEIEPLYLGSMGERAPPLRKNPGPWKISQRIDHPVPENANTFAHADVAGGADALTLAVAPAPAARGFGVKIAGKRDLESSSPEFELDLIPLRLDAGAELPKLVPFFVSLARERRLASAVLDVDFGHDPIGQAARCGSLSAWKAGKLCGTRELLRNAGFLGHLLLADGRPFHEAGAGDAQELACVLATGVEYLRLLEGEGLSLEEAQDEIAFLLPADADELLTLCKFRALRLLWASVESVCGLAPKPIRLHAETSFRMMTRYDPWVNILRGATGVFAAGIGGADAVTVLPFTLALGLPDEFARRLARNTQLILIYEAMLAKTADPAAGSGSFESVTEELCARAWNFFQKIEAQGGMVAALQAGTPQREISVAAEARREGIAHRARAITGTSAFPLLSEAPVNVLMPAPPYTAELPQELDCSALAPHRDAEPYEILRMLVEGHGRLTGEHPSIFVVKLGPAHIDSQLLDDAANFFAIAGIEAIRTASASGQDAVDAFRGSGCKIACICAPLPVSAQPIIEAARMLRAAGSARVYLAGREPETVDRDILRKDLDGIVWPRCNALAILQDATAAALTRGSASLA